MEKILIPVLFINHEKPNSSFNNLTIMDINNKLKDKIPEIRIKNENELIIEEIVNNQSLLEYKIKSNETKIRVFGKNFVKNNIGKCYIIYEDKKYKLIQYFELKNKNNNNILRIKIISINYVNDMS